MKITADALARAWHRLAAGSPLLDGTPLPPTCASYEEYEARVEDDGFTGLCLVLEDDGTVWAYSGPYDEVFVARGLDETLYCLAEEAVRGLDGTIDGRAGLMDRVDPAWGRRFRGGGPDGEDPAPPCGRDPLDGFAWIAESWREQAPVHQPGVLPRRGRQRRRDRPAVRGRPRPGRRRDPAGRSDRHDRRRPRPLEHGLGQLLFRAGG
ncbi:hypothetical protein [Streptomyces parvulus]|uniref:hypothetical protein n=1 Tax=Streptomyces parvulus TaxID=146923 RepID=UPI0036B937B9